MTAKTTTCQACRKRGQLSEMVRTPRLGIVHETCAGIEQTSTLGTRTPTLTFEEWLAKYHELGDAAIASDHDKDPTEKSFASPQWTTFWAWESKYPRFTKRFEAMVLEALAEMEVQG